MRLELAGREDGEEPVGVAVPRAVRREVLRRGTVHGPRGSRSGRAGRQRADACGRYEPDTRAPRPDRRGGHDDDRRTAAPSDGRPHPRWYPAGYLAYLVGFDDGPETGTARGQAEHEQARSRLARRRGGRARGQRRATALDAIEARSAAQDSGRRGPRRIGPAVHERARVSEVTRTRERCSAAQRAIPSLRGSEAGRKRAPGRHDGAGAARRADAARSAASIRPSLTSTATTSSCRGSTAAATMVSTIARGEAPTASTASRAPSSSSAALRSPPSATAPARLTLRLGLISA